MTFLEAKARVLSALTEFPNETDVPLVSSTDDFELCVGRKVNNRLEFEIIDNSQKMKDVFSKPWETGYIKFRDAATGQLKPVTVKFAMMVEDDDDTEMSPT